MQKTLENWKEISLLFLAGFGGLHVSASFLMAQGVRTPTLELLVQMLDLPFLLAALSFGVSHLGLTAQDFTEKNTRISQGLTVLASLVLVIAIFINLFFPDAKSF